MKSLVENIGADNVFIVSRVGDQARRMWEAVLWESGFLQDTGALKSNLRWVKDRVGPSGKWPVVRELRLTHFVDDHVDVLLDIHWNACEERKRADSTRDVPFLWLVPGR